MNSSVFGSGPGEQFVEFQQRVPMEMGRDSVEAFALAGICTSGQFRLPGTRSFARRRSADKTLVSPDGSTLAFAVRQCLEVSAMNQ
jgi:hypothetical protein